MKKLIYIASPLRGSCNYENYKYNIEMAKRYCKTVTKEGYIPIAPHLYFTEFLNDKNKKERSLGLQLGLEVLRHCNEVWVFGNEISEGMKAEIKLAKQLNIPIKHYKTFCNVDDTGENIKRLKNYIDHEILIEPSKFESILTKELEHIPYCETNKQTKYKIDDIVKVTEFDGVQETGRELYIIITDISACLLVEYFDVMYHLFKYDKIHDFMIPSIIESKKKQRGDLIENAIEYLIRNIVGFVSVTK